MNIKISIDAGINGGEFQLVGGNGIGVHSEISFKAGESEVVLIDCTEYFDRSFCQVRGIKEISRFKIQMTEC